MNLTTKQIESIQSQLTPVRTEEVYLDMLNECHEPINVCGHEYQAGDTLRSVDPIAFRCGHADYISAMLEDSWVGVAGEYYDLTEVESLIEEMEGAEQ